jgi:hypothetical protein
MKGKKREGKSKGEEQEKKERRTFNVRLVTSDMLVSGTTASSYVNSSPSPVACGRGGHLGGTASAATSAKRSLVRGSSGQKKRRRGHTVLRCSDLRRNESEDEELLCRVDEAGRKDSGRGGL